MRTAQQIQYPVGRDNEIYAAQLNMIYKNSPKAAATYARCDELRDGASQHATERFLSGDRVHPATALGWHQQWKRWRASGCEFRNS